MNLYSATTPGKRRSP